MKRRSIPLSCFMNSKHKQTFYTAMREWNVYENDLIAVVYLLTADAELWKQVEDYVIQYKFGYLQFRPKNLSVSGYTFFCAANDLYFGTDFMTLGDLTDKALLTPKEFYIIINAVLIKQYGIKAFECITEGSDVQ